MGMRSITWYCGKAWETWTPKDIEAGMAGSQLAVIFLSCQWAKLGYKVKVYNYCEGKEGVYDDVEYINYDKFNKDEVFDVLILWKRNNLDILDHEIKANKILLELQEMPYRKKEFSKSRMNKVNRIIVKSRFHKAAFTRQPWCPHITNRKLKIISNGVEGEPSKPSIEKEPYRLIYASNYYRGLEEMLKYGYPIIKEAVPQIELNVYYGWGHFNSCRKTEKDQKWKNYMIELMKNLGVKDHGRVGLDELIEEKAKSAIHYYGCTWDETDCISVRESALVGCVPVTTKYSVLAEKPYCVKIPGNPKDAKTQERIAKRIVSLLQNPRKLEKIRKKFKALAYKQNWEKVSKKWLKEF